MIYEGFLSVKAILENPLRKSTTLYLQKDRFSKSINYCRALAHQRNIEIIVLKRPELDALANSTTHGGLLIESEVIPMLSSIPENPGFYAFIEGVEDPYNLGAIVRTLYCAGYDGILTPWRDYHHLDSVLLKSSAGSLEKLKWYGLSDLEKQLDQLKASGHILIVSHRGEKSRPYYEIDFSQPHILCIGGEKRGLSKLVLDLADIWCNIVYDNKEARIALNAVSATAVLAFEKGRQLGDRV